jgi:hypothetical protein
MTYDLDWITEYADDPHVLLRTGGTDTLMHPEGCPVTLAFDWNASPSQYVPIYECPCATEAWKGDGLPATPGDGLYLLVAVWKNDRLEWEISGELMGMTPPADPKPYA